MFFVRGYFHCKVCGYYYYKTWQNQTNHFEMLEDPSGATKQTSDGMMLEVIERMKKGSMAQSTIDQPNLDKDSDSDAAPVNTNKSTFKKEGCCCCC